MKRLVTILFILIGFISHAQYPSRVTTPVLFEDVKFGKFFKPPERDTFTVTLKDTLSTVIMNGRWWRVYNRSGVARWDTVGGGVGSGGGTGEIIKANLGIVKRADSLLATYPFIGTASTLRTIYLPNTSTIYRASINGVYRDYRYRAGDTTPDDSVMVFTVPGGKMMMEYDYVDPVWFGAIPNDGIDDTYPIQKACNFARLSAKVKKVYFGTIGDYQVANLILATKNGTEYDQFALTIEGAMTSMGVGVTFYNTNLNAATILIQKAKGVDIKNIHFKGIGPNFQFVGNYITAQDAQWIAAPAGGTIRNNRKSPGQCAIAIDPFKAVGAFASTIGSGADMYPGLSAWYSNTAYSGTTNVNIEGCTMENLYVGISEGLSGEANGEGIYVNNMYANSIAYFWAAGQLQSRENAITNLYLTFSHTMLVGDGWGTGLGDIPSVNNSNCNYIKYIYETQGNFTKPRLNIYCEGIYSFGRHSSNSLVTFFNSTIALAANNVTGVTLGNAPVLAEGGGMVFENCSILAPSYYSGMPLNVDQVLFQNCYIQANLPFTTNPELGNDRIKYINCTQWLAGAVNRLDDNRNNVMTDEAIFFNRNESFIMPGGKLKALDGRTFENVGEKYDRLPAHLDQYNTGFAVTVNSTSQTLTFTAPDPGIFTAGDIIYTSTLVDNANDNYVSSTTALGSVSSVSGFVVTLNNISAGIVNGATYQMYILRLPRFINHTLGTLTSGTNTITNVIHDAGGFVNGDRIKGAGIPDGTRITNISGTTYTLSMNATASGTLVELSDAKIKVTADDKAFKYVGGNYSYDALEVIWFVGDELRNVTSGAATYGRYCIVAGKTLSGTPPTWYTGAIPDPLTVSRIHTGNTAYTLSLQGGLNNDGASIQAMGATHASLPGNIYLNIGSLERPIPSTASLHVRAFNNSLAPDLMSIDKDGNMLVNNMSGFGTRMVVASAGGVLSTMAIPGGGGGSESDPVFAADSTNIVRKNRATIFTAEQKATKWITNTSYFYDDGQAHIGSTSSSHNLLFENLALMQVPGGAMYPTIWDASGSQVISTTARILGLAGSGTRFLTTNNNGDVGAALIDTANIANFYTKVRSLFTAGTGITIVNGLITATGGGGGAGTVTDFSAGNFSPLFNTSEATTTTTPALTFTAINQNANLVFSGPSTGSAAAPTFRSLVAADIPTLDSSKVTGVHTENYYNTKYALIGSGSGGSLPSQTGHAGEFLTTNGTSASWSNDSGLVVHDATLRAPAGVLGVAPEAYSVLHKSTTITTSTYTVADGVFSVVGNYSGGTLTVTLPTASTHADAEITIKNISANNITVTPVRSGDATTLVTNDAVTYQSIGGVWMAMKRY